MSHCEATVGRGLGFVVDLGVLDLKDRIETFVDGIHQLLGGDKGAKRDCVVVLGHDCASYFPKCHCGIPLKTG